MTDRLEYRFHEPEGRSKNAFLEIATSKAVVDYVTSSRGAMLDELREPPTRQVLQRSYDDDGGMVLRFGLGVLGQGWSGQPEQRASQAMNIITQLDQAAALHDWADPRVSVTSEIGSTLGSMDDFRISFERPTDDDHVLAKNIQAGMLRAASLLRLHHNQKEDRAAISATFSPENGFALYTNGRDTQPTFAARPHRARPGQRVELLATPAGWHDTRQAHARLVAFTGIVSTLAPIE